MLKHKKCHNSPGLTFPGKIMALYHADFEIYQVQSVPTIIGMVISSAALLIATL